MVLLMEKTAEEKRTLIEAREPDSIQQLRAIRPGQHITYYVGHLAADLARSRAEAPAYANMLSRLADLAVELQECRRIYLVERQIQRDSSNGNLPIKVTQYVAVGLPERGN